VKRAAAEQLPMAALYVGLSCVAFQLDGIFIGATRTRDMRNASIASASAFVAAAWLLAARHGNRGLWAAFVSFVVARALALLLRYPALRRSIPDA
jgi:MATE family multidrug resistance protein